MSKPIWARLWIAAFTLLAYWRLSDWYFVCTAVWIHCLDHFSRHHGPRRGQEEERWRQGLRFLLLRGVSFDHSDFLTLSTLAVGAQAAIVSCGAGHNVLRVSEESRISNIKVSSNLMHQVPLTFLCEGYYLRYSQICCLVNANFVSASFYLSVLYLILLKVSYILNFLSECLCDPDDEKLKFVILSSIYHTQVQLSRCIIMGYLENASG